MPETSYIFFAVPSSFRSETKILPQYSYGFLILYRDIVFEVLNNQIPVGNGSIVDYSPGTVVVILHIQSSLVDQTADACTLSALHTQFAVASTAGESLQSKSNTRTSLTVQVSPRSPTLDYNVIVPPGVVVCPHVMLLPADRTCSQHNFKQGQDGRLSPAYFSPDCNLLRSTLHMFKKKREKCFETSFQK